MVLLKKARFAPFSLWVFVPHATHLAHRIFPAGRMQRCWRSVHYWRESAFGDRLRSQSELRLSRVRRLSSNCGWCAIDTLAAIAPFLSISRRNSVISEWSPKHTRCDSVLCSNCHPGYSPSQPASIHRPWVRRQFKRWLFACGTPSSTDNHFNQTFYRRMTTWMLLAK